MKVRFYLQEEGASLHLMHSLYIEDIVANGDARCLVTSKISSTRNRRLPSRYAMGPYVDQKGIILAYRPLGVWRKEKRALIVRIDPET